MKWVQAKLGQPGLPLLTGQIKIKVTGHDSHGVRHLGMGASSPKMRIEKRKSAASVSSCLDGGK